jgi:putative ABC transport system ATP-binding protein
MALLEAEGLTKVFGTGDTAVTALSGVNLQIEPGEFVAVMGPSGSGKSTLLHLLGGLDGPTAGRIRLDGIDLTRLNDTELTKFRRRKIGFIFQYYNLLPMLGAGENAALPLILDGVGAAAATARVAEWLRRLGLEDRLLQKPNQLSGGQQQKVAIARALAAQPALILADEPTGNLDSRASDEVVTLLRQITDECRRTVLMVTHDSRMAAYTDRIIFLKDGTVVNETRLSGAGNDQPGRIHPSVDPS